jgi:hypothetical protein
MATFGRAGAEAGREQAREDPVGAGGEDRIAHARGFGRRARMLDGNFAGWRDRFALPPYLFPNAPALRSEAMRAAS